MNILWFTNTPSGYKEKYLKKETTSGGWFFSLEQKFKSFSNVNLSIAFISKEVGELKKIKCEGVNYYLVPPPNKFRKLLYKFKHSFGEKYYKSKYLDVIEDADPEIIQIWGTERNFGTIIEEVNIPIVIHIQGLLTVCSHKYFASGISIHQIFRPGRLFNFFKKRGYYWSFRRVNRKGARERRFLSHAKYIIGRTFWDKYVTRILAPQAEYYHNDEMLRNEFYKNSGSWSHEDHSKKRILTISHGNIYKGFETIIRTTSLLEKKMVLEWRIIGIEKGNQILKLFQDYTNIDLDSLPILPLGKRNASNIISEMQKADLLVHPSHIENSPNSICEAMMVGVPIIATYTGGTGALLENYEEGLLVQDGDPWALSGAILEILEKPKFAKRMGKNANRKALQRHDKEKITSSLFNIYKEILN